MSTKQFSLLLFAMLGLGTVQILLVSHLGDKITTQLSDTQSTVISSANKSETSDIQTAAAYQQLSTGAAQQNIDDLKKVIREEIRNVAVEIGSKAGAPPVNIVKKEPSPYNQEYYSQTSSSLEQAISRGTWTRADYESVATHINELTQDQRNELALRFADSINNREIDLNKLDPTTLPPF